ncbi:MAG TPA: glycoside hydrolase family 36 protein [Bryobacteraceae bacterium]|nr:glycoside hydrolase family 36 protein [Bryobacteraceae bacterium]
MRATVGIICALGLAFLGACGKSGSDRLAAEGPGIRLEFDKRLHSRVVARFPGREAALGGFTPSEYVSAGGADLRDFPLDRQESADVHDALGKGVRKTFSGRSASLAKQVLATVYEAYPSTVVLRVRYTNVSSAPLKIDRWISHNYALTPQSGAAAPPFWSYQSGSYESRPDWILPLKAGFLQDNYMGMNASDYGGGTPVSDVWRRDAGIGVGHLEPAPKLVSLPVTMPDDKGATLAVTFTCNRTLQPGETLETFDTFVTAHEGDAFRTLATYRKMMEARGTRLVKSPDQAFEPIWCAWGYGRKVKPAQIYGALPIVKKIGFGWVTVDDGWQTAEGDWFLDPKKFVNGDRDMKAIVDRIHADGFKAQLWWAPLAADPGTELLRRHPEQLLLNADGSKQKISWWDSWYLCPANRQVVEYHEALVRKIIGEWGFDGLKLDGQFMNGVPACYNPAHRHANPQQSVEALPLFFKGIYDTARQIKPDALVEFCPCGTAYSFFMLPFMNMAVASDPGSSWQVRLKGKTLKALAGDSLAYFGDHVDMSDGGDDFASTVGVGGVVGTNFTWPEGSAGNDRRARKLDLTPAKVDEWTKWVKIYREKMLPRGTYRGELYDIGFDRPEAHAIAKADRMYYAFYAPEWDGRIELRGLAARAYRITDYESGRDLVVVRGPQAAVQAKFARHLLLEAVPEAR